MILRHHATRSTLDAALDLLQVFLLHQDVDHRLEDATSGCLRDQAVDSAVVFSTDSPTVRLLDVSAHRVLDLSNLSLGRPQRREPSGLRLDGPPRGKQLADIFDGLGANRLEEVAVVGILAASTLQGGQVPAALGGENTPLGVDGPSQTLQVQDPQQPSCRRLAGDDSSGLEGAADPPAADGPLVAAKLLERDVRRVVAENGSR